MGFLYDIMSAPGAYLKRSVYEDEPVAWSKTPTKIGFGDNWHQHCVLWEPDCVTHETPVFYFHGGSYVFGTPESLVDAANAYNSQGYRFFSIGYRVTPPSKFPAMVEDAFMGVRRCFEWLEEQGLSSERAFVGGTSAGGHLAELVCYGKELQEAHALDTARLAGCISIAGVSDADDILVRPFPAYVVWRLHVDLPSNGFTRKAMRDAVRPYSPVLLVEDCDPVPLFAVHGCHDRISPYRAKATLVEKLNAEHGEETARLVSLRDRKKQHMNTTVGFYKDRIAGNEALEPLFEWMARIDASETCKGFADA